MKHYSVPRIIQVTCAVAFILLATMVKNFPHSGESALILSQKLGIDPFPGFSSPIYGWIINGLAAVSGSAQHYVINLFSAACASILLGFVFAIAYRSARGFNVEGSFPSGAMHRIQLAAGLVAVLYLMACWPFWISATRAGSLPFDLLLLIIPYYLANSYSEKAHDSRMLLACALYGVAMVEFSTAILLFPLFVLLMLARLYKANTLNGLFLGKALLFGASGLLPFFVHAGIYATQPVYDWREFKHLGQLFYYMGLEHYYAITRQVPRVGWLTMALVSIVPFSLTAAFRVPSGPGRAPSAIAGTAALNIILLVLGILLLTDFPLSPVNISGTQQIFLTPYILIGLWFAQVMAFWLVVLFRARRFEDAWKTKARRYAGGAIAVAVPVCLVVILFSTAVPEVRRSAREGSLIHQFATTVLEAAGNPEWLISNSPIDDVLALEIHRRELPVKLIRLDYGRSRASMKYVATLFEGQSRLQSLARIGMEPLLDEWLPSMADAPEKLKIVNVPDLWLVSGFEAVPDRVLFSGFAESDNAAIEQAFKRTMDFWSAEGRDYLPDESRSGARTIQAINWIRLHLSKVANNLGVVLEDAGRPDEAKTCYRKARDFFPENLSALMNLHVLAQKENQPEFAGLDEELKRKTEALAGRLQSISLSQMYGFVRVPELFIDRGMSFARTGNMELAISDLRRALRMKSESSQIELALAGLYMGSEQDVKSKEHYQAVLEKEPGNPVALHGLLRLAMRARDYVEARRLLEVLKASGIAAESLRMEDAVLEALSGSPAKSLELMEGLAEENPQDIRIWAAIAAIAADLKLPGKIEEATQQIEKAGIFIPAVKMILAQSAMNQGDVDGARAHLNELLRRSPKEVAAMEMLLRLDLLAGTKREDANRLVQQILSVDPQNYLANYMLGVEHYMNEEYILAESAYRASIATQKTPEALNDLAFVIHLQGRNGEAEPYARESLALNEVNGQAWDTLGVILMDLDKLEESEAALKRALSLRPDNAGILLSLALLHEKQKRLDESRKIASSISNRLNELAPAEQEKLRNLSARLE